MDFLKLQHRNGLTYEINNQVPFSGIGLLTTRPGQWKNLIRYKDGKYIGSELYYENGQYEYKSEKIGKFEYRKYFYPDGESNIKANSKRTFLKVWEWFDKKGNKKKEIAYQSLNENYKLLDENLNVF